MKNKITKTLLTTAIVLMTGASAIAASTQKEVIDAMHEKNWTKAQVMLVDVVREQPGNARAWYFMALTEAQLGHYASSGTSLARAKTLNPRLDFANAETTQKLELFLTSAAQSQEAKTLSWKKVPALQATASTLPMSTGKSLWSNWADYFYAGGAALLVLIVYAAVRLKSPKIASKPSKKM